MDGDNHQRKQHDPSNYPSVPGLPRHAVQQPQLPPGRSAEHFRRPSLQPARQGDMPVPAHGRNAHLPDYSAYGYTSESSLQSGSLQGSGLQYQSSFPSESLRQESPPEHSHQRESQQQQQQFSQYAPNLVYGLDQQGQAQASYEIAVPAPYEPRQSAALGALPAQFGVPQYFTPTGQAGSGDSGVYLTPQEQQAMYHQQNPLGRSSAPSYSAAMADYNPIGATEGVEQQETAQESTNLEDAYGRYKQALTTTFDYTRAGRLVDASRLLLEISEWLVSNARDLGLLRDEQDLHKERLKLWENFNLCWLSLFQKQKDLTRAFLETGQQQPNTSMLTVDIMKKMGNDLVQLCDKMEPHGLVDYQIGIWEEEILSVLTQCLDLVEGGSKTTHPIVPDRS
ncbi:hypothetical protein VTN96DRAFT_6056 [Rasamsonia emersonii]